MKISVKTRKPRNPLVAPALPPRRLAPARQPLRAAGRPARLQRELKQMPASP